MFIYSGTLNTGTAEQRQGSQRERIGKIYRMRMRTSAKKSNRLGAGEIVAVMGLKDTTTGETLCDPA